MSCRDFEEKDNAPQLPSFIMQTKVSHNDGACHAGPNAEGTENESDAYVEIQLEKHFDESTGKKRKYHPFHQYTEIKR